MAPKANKKRAKKKPLTEKRKAQIVEKKPKAGKKLVSKARSDEGTKKSLYLPEEIIFDILKWLPSISLLQFKEHPFLPMITSKPFVDSHFACSSSRPEILISCFCWTNWHHQPNCYLYWVDLEHLRAVPFTFFNLKRIKDSRFGVNEVSNCVNGVIMLKRNDKFRACNLSTREFIDVPLAYPECGSRSYLLGFDPHTKNFKILAYSLTGKNKFYILTLGTNVWRKVESSPHSCIDEVVYINGTIYIGGKWQIGINAFDLATEKFRPIQLPVPPNFFNRPTSESRCSRMFQFNESLGFADFKLANEETINIRVWKLTENFLWVEKTKNSLSLPFKFKASHFPCSIGGLWVSPVKDDELLLFVRFTSQCMIRWNLKNNTTQHSKIYGLPKSHYRYCVDPYVQNLVSLKDL